MIVIAKKDGKFAIDGLRIVEFFAGKELELDEKNANRFVEVALGEFPKPKKVKKPKKEIVLDDKASDVELETKG